MMLVGAKKTLCFLHRFPSVARCRRAVKVRGVNVVWDDAR